MKYKIQLKTILSPLLVTLVLSGCGGDTETSKGLLEASGTKARHYF